MDVEVGWIKGVLIGFSEPSTVVVGGVGSVTSVEACRAGFASGAWPLLLGISPATAPLVRGSWSIGN